jgi:hypothetical protein
MRSCARCAARRAARDRRHPELADVLEFLAAGATAIQIGTANFREPGVSGRLVEELGAWCAARRTPVTSSSAARTAAAAR